MNRMRQSVAPPSLEAQLGGQLVAALTAHSQRLSHDITERLRFAREQAVIRAHQSRIQSAGGVALVGVSGHGAATLAVFAPWWRRTASLLPLLMLVAGLQMIDRWDLRDKVQAAAEIDAQLLSDTLPPTAYSDPGFGEFLRGSPAP